MAREDVLLRVGMGRLEIEPIKLIKLQKEENPFTHRSQQKKLFILKPCIHSEKCICSSPKKTKSVTIIKKKHSRVLREPVLKLSKCLFIKDFGLCQKATLLNQCELTVHKIKTDNLSLKTLVDNCNQLSISSDGCCLNSYRTVPNGKSRLWKNDAVTETSGKESGVEISQTGSCSHQALNPPCDVTIDELASYFETLVHIPKKMSSMAEMMYI